MCKKVLTTNPPRERRKIFFTLTFCEDPKIDARSPILIL